MTGWRPINTAPLARCEGWSRNARTAIFEVDAVPNVIEGRTTRGSVVRAYYTPKGDYLDRWTDRSGRVIYTLTHWRPVKSTVSPR